MQRSIRDSAKICNVHKWWTLLIEVRVANVLRHIKWQQQTVVLFIIVAGFI